MVESKRATRKPVEKPEKPSEPKYDKATLLKYEGFSKIKRDFLSAYLEEGKTYTIKEAEDTLNKKLEGKVK